MWSSRGEVLRPGEEARISAKISLKMRKTIKINKQNILRIFEPDRLQGARLVVGQHDGDQDGVGGDVADNVLNQDSGRDGRGR